jgi:aldehyde decarbonylase
LQGEELNKNGELYIQKYPQLRIKLVDGSSLAVAVVLNSIPKGTTQVFLRGNLTKVAYAIANALCERGIQVRFNCLLILAQPRLQCFYFFFLMLLSL